MEGPNLAKIPDIITDRKRYEETLYTPLSEAYEELMRRRQDKHLERKVLRFLNGDVPLPLRKEPKAVLPRSVISPNYEARRFGEILEQFGKIKPLYWEYTADKFTSNNELKRMLGRLSFFYGRGKRHGAKVESFNIIDFPASDGEHLSAVTTLWGQSLVEFHHGFFDATLRKLSRTFYDSSRWLDAHGGRAGSYYPAFLALFIRHGILFEDVLLNSKEIGFTKHVFLPAFLSLHRLFNVKPLVVPIATKENEDDPLWYCYPASGRAYVEKTMGGLPGSISKKFFIKDTGRYGEGVFAARDIARGEIIHTFNGKTLDVRELVGRINADREGIDDPLQVGKRTYLDLDETSRTFNHSCDPNAALRKRSELFAIKDIPKGAEIAYDYSATIAPTEWKMRCACGAENCRKMLGDVLSIPKATRVRYRKLGALQDYMKKLLDGIERDGTYRMPAYETASLEKVKKTSNL